MQPDDFDAAYLFDMLDAAQSVVKFVSDKTQEQFELDEILRAAVERKTTIIGEAASQISRPFKDAHPEVAWKPITATRHILVHDYSDVNGGAIWRIATIHAPALIDQLKALLPPLDPPADPTAPD